MEASESGSIQLLKEKKKVKGSKNDLLVSLSGVSGEDMLFDNFKEVYEQLHTSCLDGSMLLIRNYNFCWSYNIVWIPFFS